MRTGTIGELLVQLRLLEYGVQAAPPLKDSGNDLIGIHGRNVKFIQVKTSKNRIPQARNLPELCHLVFLVKLKIREDEDKELIILDESKIYIRANNGRLGDKIPLSQESVDKFWQ